jgi:TusA-related sulfurtransferase
MQKTLEVLGMVCPFPLIEAKNEMEEIASGDELVINFDCTQATESIPRWAAEEGHTVTNFEQLDEASWTITVKKK